MCKHGVDNILNEQHQASRNRRRLRGCVEGSSAKIARSLPAIIESAASPSKILPVGRFTALTPVGSRLDPDWTTRKPRRLRYPNMLAGNNCTRAFAAGKSKRVPAGEGRKQLG